MFSYFRFYRFNLSLAVCIKYSLIRGPGSSVGIATEPRAGRSGIESRWGRNFPPSRPALGTTQPPVQWVSGVSRG